MHVKMKAYADEIRSVLFFDCSTGLGVKFLTLLIRLKLDTLTNVYFIAKLRKVSQVYSETHIQYSTF